jgi:hypothetical protein
MEGRSPDERSVRERAPKRSGGAERGNKEPVDTMVDRLSEDFVFSG